MSDMRAALVAIQELHSKNVPAAIACGECHDRFPCPTRKLADEGLADRMARTNQGDNNE